MAISWPIFQAQLRGIIPTNVQQTSGVPDVSELVYKGLKGVGQNFVDARNQAAVEELKRIQLAQQERELALNEEYRRGILGVQQGELAIKQGQQQNWAEMARAAGGLYAPGGATAPAGGPGPGADASRLPSFVRSGGAMSNLDTATRLYNKLVERNIDPKVAAGVVGQMGPESAFNSSALNPNDKGQPSFGLIQHRADRAARLHGGAAKKGVHWSDEDNQIDTIAEELLGSENAAYKAALAAGSPAEAAAILAEKFIRPSKSNLIKTMPERMAIAEAVGRGVPTSRTPGTPPPDAIVPPPASPQRVASLDPSAGLVPPPMGGTPQPAPVGPAGALPPPPPVPPPAPPVRQQEQVMPGSPLFPQTPGPAMTMPGNPAAVAVGPPPAPPPAPMPAPTAQAGGVREVVPAQIPDQGQGRNSPQVRAFLAKALAAGPEAYNAAAKHIDTLFPKSEGRFTNSERGVFDTHTGRLVAPQAQLDGSGGTFGNSMQAKALEASVARGHITMDQAIEQAGGQVIGAPGGEQRFFTPRALAGAVSGGSGMVAPGTPQPSAGGAPGAPAGAPGLGVQLVPPKTEKADVLPPNAALAVGMGNSFLADDLPKIKRVVADNPTVLTGAKGRIMYHLGIGAPGEVGRAMEKAQESLVRLLTGAAMNEGEVTRYSKRYGFRPERDSIEDVKKKLNEVESMIKVGRDAILAGRKIDTKELIGWEEEMKRDEKGFERVSP